MAFWHNFVPCSLLWSQFWCHSTSLAGLWRHPLLMWHLSMHFRPFQFFFGTWCTCTWSSRKSHNRAKKMYFSTLAGSKSTNREMHLSPSVRRPTTHPESYGHNGKFHFFGILEPAASASGRLLAACSPLARHASPPTCSNNWIHVQKHFVLLLSDLDLNHNGIVSMGGARQGPAETHGSAPPPP